MNIDKLTIIYHFSQDLVKDKEIKWIGSLPDAISQTRRKNPELIKTIFPKVKYRSQTSSKLKAFKDDKSKSNNKWVFKTTSL